MTDALEEVIEAMARAIREEIVRQYRDNERHKGPLSSHDYEEMVAPTQILRSALRAASAAGWRMERDWQSIETAPKDGTHILVFPGLLAYPLVASWERPARTPPMMLARFDSPDGRVRVAAFFACDDVLAWLDRHAAPKLEEHTMSDVTELVERLRIRAAYYAAWASVVRVRLGGAVGVDYAEAAEDMRQAAAALAAQAEEIERLRAEVKREERDQIQLIEERDALQDLFDELYVAFFGASPEYSNLFNATDAFNEMDAELSRRTSAQAAERERCAKIAEEHPWPTQTTEALWPIERTVIAAAIRGGSDASD